MNTNIRYKVLAKKVENEIQEAKRSVGEKMISLRKFAKLNNVSLTTAIRCYDYLQELGYLVSIPKSGYIIQLPLKYKRKLHFPHFEGVIQDVQMSKTKIKKEHSSPFSTAQLGSDISINDILKRCIIRVLHQQDSTFFMYADPRGSENLREALSLHYTKRGFPFRKKNLLITNGCIDAISHAIEVTTNENDVILVQSPCYSGILELIALMNRRIIEIPNTEEGTDLIQFERFAKEGSVQACIISSTNQNPTGHSLSIHQKQWLAEFARKYKIPIIEDDIYSELNHNGITPLPIKYWDTDGWVIWCNSASKTLSAGLRIGWCEPGKFYDHLLKHRKLKTLGVNFPLQEGLAEFINTGNYHKHLSKLNSKLKENVTLYSEFLYKVLPENTIISAPKGGTVLWIQIRNLDSTKLATLTNERQIAIRSGILFSSRGLYKDCFRLNIGWAFSDEIKKSLLLLSELVRESIKKPF